MLDCWGKGIALYLLGSPSAILVWQEGGSPQPPMGRSVAARCPRQGVEGAHKGLPSREMMSLIPSFAAWETVWWTFHR